MSYASKCRGLILMPEIARPLTSLLSTQGSQTFPLLIDCTLGQVRGKTLPWPNQTRAGGFLATSESITRNIGVLFTLRSSRSRGQNIERFRKSWAQPTSTCHATGKICRKLKWLCRVLLKWELIRHLNRNLHPCMQHLTHYFFSLRSTSYN